jgi:hypothetical protein
MTSVHNHGFAKNSSVQPKRKIVSGPGLLFSFPTVLGKGTDQAVHPGGFGRPFNEKLLKAPQEKALRAAGCG